jgi:CubicO group peptidase (beta-lactamase class C family)
VDVDLSAVAEGVVATGAAPCAVVGAAAREAGGWRYGWGVAGHLWTVPPRGAAGPAPEATLATVFDLASLSKLATGLVLARLGRARRVSRDDALADCLGALAETPSGPVSLDLLSAHRAGLEAHRELWVPRPGATQPSRDRMLAEAACARRAECTGALPPGGFAPIYSDLGYILLGAALEAAGGAPMDKLVERELPLGSRVLGSARRLERRDPGWRARVAPTEDVGWRGGVLWGVVHDENAFVLAGTGSTGHAGLFGDVRAVVDLGVLVLDAWHGRARDWLGPDDLAPLVDARDGARAAFDRRGAESPASGSRFGPATFGHLGFTGTSLWIDPDREIAATLLSNRVHPSRGPTLEAIRRARPAAYDAIWAIMAG